MVRSPCYEFRVSEAEVDKMNSTHRCSSITEKSTRLRCKRHLGCYRWTVLIFLIGLLHTSAAAKASSLIKSSGDLRKPRIIQSSGPVIHAVEGTAIHLHCSVTGTPTPTVNWFDADTGKLVIPRSKNVNSNMHILKTDLLITSLKESNEGHYYCNASNIHGYAISPNITLVLASLGRKFKQSPQNKNAREGETVQMECRPPKGIPPPKVTWMKDGTEIQASRGDEHYIIQKNGDLRINQARLSDRGRYRCVAKNVYGVRKSKGANLEVRRKPQFIRQPQDVLATVNQDVRFYCVVAGDPAPVIIWRREDGSRLVSSRRTKILSDKSLLIERVQLADEGKYVCNASNSAGQLEAVAKLSVSAPPSFYRTPEDQVAAIGQRVTFYCVVAGRPKPDVYWRTNKDDSLLFARKAKPEADKNFKVYDDGRLVIQSVRKSDAGRYVCHANSYLKQIRSSAVLTVEDRELHPPPVIELGPQNQTLLEGANAILRCIASPLDPRPKVVWYKGRLRMVLDFKDHRIFMQPSGVLQIADVKVEDSANYTCVVTLGPYSTRWTASLRVLAKTEPISRLQQKVVRAPEEFSLFPRKPSRLKVTDVGDTWAVLSWEVGKTSYHGPVAQVLSYQIERFSPEDKLGWVVLEPHCKDMKYKVRNLKPKTKYYFLVRASNINGLGRPYRIRDAIRTLPKRNLLQGIINKPSIVKMVRVTNFRLQVTGHDTMKVFWNVKGPDNHLRAVSGFVVRYKPVMLTRCILVQQEEMVSYTYCSLKPPLFAQLSRELSQNGYSFLKETRELRQTVQEHVSRQTSRVATIIKDLKPFHCYEVDVVPFFYNHNYGRITGRVSGARKALTYDSVPSQPPVSIAAKWLSNTTVELRWGPPPLDGRNGVITGFNVHVIGNETRFNKFLKTNNSVFAVILKSMNPRIAYTIHLAARTCKGEGIRSMALKLSPIPQASGNHFLREPWFIGTMVGCGLLWLVLCIITIIVCKRYMQQKRLPYKPVLPAYSNGTLKERGGSGGPGGGLAMHSLDPNVVPPPDLTNMLQEKGQHRDLMEDPSVMSGMPGCLPQVAPVINPVSPYATTSLITNQAFHPPAYSNSDTTSAGKASSTCNYVPPAHMCTNTGQYSDGMGCRTCSDCGSQATADELEAIMANSGMRGQQQSQTVPQPQRWPNSTTPPRHKMLNIGEIIPPPPEYPPPPPGGNSATTPSSQNSGEQQGQQRGYRETTKSPPTDQRKPGDNHQPLPGVTSPALSGRVSSIGTRSSSASGGANSTTNVYHQLLPPAEQARLHQEHPQEEEEDGDYSDLSDRCESPDFHSSLLGEASETCPSALASAYSDSVGSEEPDMSSVVSSVASEDEAFLRPGERDFATSVQMAADAHRRRGANRNHHQYNKPGSRRHQRAHSPGYSTDSTNYGVLPSPKKSYPKSQRRRQQQAKATASAEPSVQTIPAYAFGNHPVA